LVRPVPSDSIDEQAARWVTVALDDAMSVETRGALEKWLALDRRHRGAYLRARAGLILLEDAVQGGHGECGGDKPIASNDDDTRKTALADRTWLSRNRLTAGAIAASLTLLLGISMSALWTIEPKAGRESVAASTRRALRLADGSIATLGQGAQIDFSMQDGTRKVVLVGGEASFQVAKDRAHPFVVQSGDVYAQATGTVYSVRRVGDKGGAIHVDEGSVLVWARDDREQAVLLHAGGTLTLEPGQRQDQMVAQREVRPTAPPPVVAQIALDNVTIAAAAARFNRVNQMQIQIADPAIAETRIVGLFRADDPQHFAKAAAVVASGEVELARGRIVIKSK
jgi:transmembrane sensor